MRSIQYELWVSDRLEITLPTQREAEKIAFKLIELGLKDALKIIRVERTTITINV